MVSVSFLLCAWGALGPNVSRASTAGVKATPDPSHFRFQLGNEPTFIDHADLKSGRGSPLLNMLACPLMRVDGHLNITPLFLECPKQPKGLIWTCTWRTNAKTFSNGTPITAEHLRNTVQVLYSPESPSPFVSLLSELKNHEAVLNGKKKFSELGLRIKGEQVEFAFSKVPRPDFMLALSHPVFSPRFKVEKSNLKNWKEHVSCSDFNFVSWESGRSLTLMSRDQTQRVEYLFLEDEIKAIALFRQNQLDFVRRVPSAMIGQLEKDPHFLKVDQIRFDSFLFHSREKDWVKVIAPLAQAIDLKAWQKIYFAKPRPGCFGFPKSWTGGSLVCWESASHRDEWTGPKSPLVISYSKSGGSDHDRTVQFLMETWQKKWGIKVVPNPVEGKIFLENLKKGQFQMARRGLISEVPGCLSTLKSFTGEHPDNVADIQIPELESVLAQWPPHSLLAPELCRRGLEILRDKAGLIPTGPIYFSYLLRKINSAPKKESHGSWVWTFSPWGEIWLQKKGPSLDSYKTDVIDYF